MTILNWEYDNIVKEWQASDEYDNLFIIQSFGLKHLLKRFSSTRSDEQLGWFNSLSDAKQAAIYFSITKEQKL